MKTKEQSAWQTVTIAEQAAALDCKVYALDGAGNIRHAYLGELAIGDKFAFREDLEPAKEPKPVELSADVYDILTRITDFNAWDGIQKTVVWLGVKKVEIPGIFNLVEMAQYIAEQGGVE